MTPLKTLLAFANRLKFRTLFLLTVTLFMIDLLVPDFIPLIDELMLGLLTILFGSWKKHQPQDDQGILIEGEVINQDED